MQIAYRVSLRNASNLSHQSAGNPVPAAIAAVLRQPSAALGGGARLGVRGCSPMAVVEPSRVATAADGPGAGPCQEASPPEVSHFSAESIVNLNSMHETHLNPRFFAFCGHVVYPAARRRSSR